MTETLAKPTPAPYIRLMGRAARPLELGRTAMLRTFDFYIDRALEAQAAGFRTKAAKKQAMEDATTAYGIARKEIMDSLLGNRAHQQKHQHDNQNQS